MTARHECSKNVTDDGWHWHPCSRPATVECDSKWYCWQHNPERVKAEAEKRQVAQKAKEDAKAAKYTRIARNARLGQLVTLESATLLEQLVDSIEILAGKYTMTERTLASLESARTLAARIREVLAQETIE